MSLKTIHSKDYHNLLNNVIENELAVTQSDNQVLWVQMGSQLEIEGIEKIQISTLVRKDIEDILWKKQFKDYMSREDYRYTNSKYFEVMKENGWTNPYMARNINLDPRMDQKIIPSKNPDMTNLCKDIIEVAKTLRDKSRSIDSLDITFGKKEMKEFYKQRKTIINNCKNAIDSKTKVPKNTELFLLEYLATIMGSVNKCAEIFMEQNLIRLKKQLTISVRTGKPVPFFTLKQATKFQKGGKQSQLNILKPKTRETALYGDYSGVQCTCGSWRVRDKQDSNDLECYDCDKVLPKGHISKCISCQIPLYKERLVWMVKHNNKCENCEVKNDLPQELILYAKS